VNLEGLSAALERQKKRGLTHITISTEELEALIAIAQRHEPQNTITAMYNEAYGL
jgi:hypothetical protein